MSSDERYSDEHINAYIDGELGSEERTQLLFDEQHDAELADRINQARILKEKVQLAYEHLNHPSSTRQQTSHWANGDYLYRSRAAVAVFLLVTAATLAVMFSPSEDDLAGTRTLIASTEAIPANNLVAYAGTHDNVIIDLNHYDPSSFDKTIENIAQLASDTSQHIEVVANGEGLRALDATTSVYAPAITALSQSTSNLDIIACAQSLANLAESDNPIKLITAIATTPSALQQIAKRSAQGWRYLKLQ